jgi:formylglycine-generating enzyme required for sulfatase activity
LDVLPSQGFAITGSRPPSLNGQPASRPAQAVGIGFRGAGALRFAVRTPYALVAGGPFVSGGDPLAFGSPLRAVVDLPDFAISRFPVTCAEYLVAVLLTS